MPLSWPVRWRAPLYNPSGYASEALQFILPLAEQVELGVMHDCVLRSDRFEASLSDQTRFLLADLEEKYSTASGGITVWHNPANGFGSDPEAAANIGRTMFETDRISEAWVSRCNRMDEVWVPSAFNLESFASSGVCRHKLHVVPGAVDCHLFDPARHEPMPLPQRAAYNFLAMFEWSARKGWDVLLSAYLQEFSAEDDVCLYLRCYLFNRPDENGEAVVWRRIRELGSQLGIRDKPWPRIELITHQIAPASLPGLFRAMDCLVAPSRGEGWGRPQHEAMLMALPVIGTNWSGNTEFMNEHNSYLLDYELENIRTVEPELWHYRGHRWANPSVNHLRRLMRHVEQHPEEARTTGCRARADLSRDYSPGRVGKQVLDRLTEMERRLCTPVCPAVLARQLMVAVESPGHQPALVEVAWEGSYMDHGSLSLVNRELTRELSGRDGLRLTRVSTGSVDEKFRNDPAHAGMERRVVYQSPCNARVTVRHGWPPNWQRPASGAWVLIQPWEFGAIPADWVERMNAVDEIWVYSRHVWQTYVDSGVEPRKIRIVPLGVNTDRYRPGVKRTPLATRKSFKFLYVGGRIRRKGFDVLLSSYLRAFTADDDVCLVIKEFGTDGVYAGKTMEGLIEAAQAETGTPQILRITEAISTAAMGGLYAACHCLVHPYRGEGFGLTVLEAMACGLPVIVTGGGATDDFATDEFAYRIPANRVSIGGTVDGHALARNGWLLEPDQDALTRQMREVFEHPEDASAKGLAASRHVREQWSWKQSAAIASQRISNLVARQDANTSAREQERQQRACNRPVPVVSRSGALDEARTLQDKNRWDEAWDCTVEAIRMRPFHPEAFCLLGQIAAASKDFFTARQCAESALRLAPSAERAKRLLTEGAPVPASPSGGRPGIADLTQPGRKPRLSICLIARNEARNLARCLASVKSVAWQLIVVDTGSNDGTVEIARDFGAEVYRFDWCDDFSAARNEALAHARGDWVLSLDADEELPSESLADLERHLESPEAIAFRLPLTEAGKAEEGCHYVPRLFRNAPGVCFSGRIHEHPFGSLEAMQFAWGLENRLGTAKILHHGYAESSAGQHDKTVRNLRLLQIAIEESPEDPNLQMNLGLELARAGRLADALPWYRAAFNGLSALPPNAVTPEMRETLLTQFATHLLTANRPDQAVKLLQSPLAAPGLSASQEFILGLCLVELGRMEEALKSFRTCLDRRKLTAFGSVNPKIHQGAPEHCMAVCFWKLGRTDEARAAFGRALSSYPDARFLKLDWARFLNETGDSIQALGVLHELVTSDAGHVDAWRLGGQIALHTASTFEFAADWTAEAAKLHPTNHELRWQHAEAQLLTGNAAGALVSLKSGAPSGSRVRAVCLMCQSLAGESVMVKPSVELKLSRAILEWYRTLVDRGAIGLVTWINKSIEAWGSALPTAARVLKTTLQEVATA